MSLYEKKLQISQVRVDMFEIEGEAESLAEEKAGKFMEELAKDYALDKINRRDLCTVRDQRLSALGLLKKRQALRGNVLFYEFQAGGPGFDNLVSLLIQDNPNAIWCLTLNK